MYKLIPKKYDQWLLLFVLLILGSGLIMMMSIGVPKSMSLSASDLTFPDCSDKAVDCYLILKNHFARIAIGLVAMFVAWKINYRFWKTMGPIVFGLGAILLTFVLFGGDNNNTFASSWINLPGVPFVNSLQPSEIAKFGLICYLSYFLAEKLSPQKLEDWKEGFLKFALISGTMVGLILLQPDFGSALVMCGIATTIYFLAGAPLKHFGAGILLGTFLVLILLATQPHARGRINAFFDSSKECQEQDCWQTRQANIAIGSGGIWGRGITKGVQKSYWLPQAVDDFIFAASAEEIGFLRSVIIVLLYFGIAYRGFKIAYYAPNKFAMLMAGGISAWISVQSFLNIMVNTALFPITGITLPFMSYGGTSMVTTLFAVGVLLNISNYTQTNAYSVYGGRNRRSRNTQSSYRRLYR